MSTITPFTDMAPVPRVLVDVPVVEFPAGSVTVSLTRTAEGRTFDVRGAQRLPAASPVIAIDPEAAFGIPSSYTVVGYDNAGSIVGSWPVGTVTLDFDGVVIQQPLDPRLSVQAQRISGTATTVTRSTPGRTAYTQGSVLPGLVALGPRRGVEGMALKVLVASYEDADRLQATLGTYENHQLPVWLVRTPPGQRFPRVFFCNVPQLTEEPVVSGAANEWVTFSTVVDEIRPPAAGITAVALTHSDMKVFFSTHTEVKALYATHSDIKRDTSLIGAADA